MVTSVPILVKSINNCDRESVQSDTHTHTLQPVCLMLRYSYAADNKN